MRISLGVSHCDISCISGRIYFDASWTFKTDKDVDLTHISNSISILFSINIKNTKIIQHIDMEEVQLKANCLTNVAPPLHNTNDNTNYNNIREVSLFYA